MPEISEVHLMVDAIRDIITNKQLIQIEVLGGRYWDAKTHQPRLNNLSEISSRFPLLVQSINVKGKFCWIHLDQGWYIAITFGMTGAIYYEPTDEVLRDYSMTTGKPVSREEYMKHFHLKFVTNDGQCFYFGDSRHFGTITISQDQSALRKKLNKLGPDMLDNPPIADEQFLQIFRSPKFSHNNICQVLMGQEAISGVGNYIKAEVLYACQINPWALISDLDDRTLISLYHAIREIAHMAYQGRGASLYSYTGTRREKGTFQNMLKVYGKSEDPQGHPVRLILESQSPDKRTTHYVPIIQTLGQSRDPDWIASQPHPKIVIRLKPK